MTPSGAESAIFSGLFGDPETAALFADGEVVRALLEVEVALARVQARLELIPADAAERIADAAGSFAADFAELGAGTERFGVPTIALLGQFRASVGDAGAYVHRGATSQDIIDTGLVLRLRRLHGLLAPRLDRIIDRLAELADHHRGTVMVARTRSQQAVPTTFGLKAANWLAPIARHRDRFDDLKPRLLVVQFGGAAGTLAALGDRGLEVMAALADALGLGVPAAPWHSQRDAIAEIAGWLALVTGSLGKLGQDVVLLSQSEVREVYERTDEREGSSTMPQKANPIAGETLVALARLNAGLLATVHQAALQEHERGGPGWQLEWLALPQMAVACGAALRHAETLLTNLVVDTRRMRRNLDAANGLILAEAAVFALARHLPRDDAEALVKDACREVRKSGRHLIEVLKQRSSAPVDWDALADPSNYLGAADAFISRILQSAER